MCLAALCVYTLTSTGLPNQPLNELQQLLFCNSIIIMPTNHYCYCCYTTYISPLATIILNETAGGRRQMFPDPWRMFPESLQMFPESRRMFAESRRMFPESRRMLLWGRYQEVRDASLSQRTNTELKYSVALLISSFKISTTTLAGPIPHPICCGHIQ